MTEQQNDVWGNWQLVWQCISQSMWLWYVKQFFGDFPNFINFFPCDFQPFLSNAIVSTLTGFPWCHFGFIVRNTLKSYTFFDLLFSPILPFGRTMLPPRFSPVGDGVSSKWVKPFLICAVFILLLWIQEKVFVVRLMRFKNLGDIN